MGFGFLQKKKKCFKRLRKERQNPIGGKDKIPKYEIGEVPLCGFGQNPNITVIELTPVGLSFDRILMIWTLCVIIVGNEMDLWCAATLSRNLHDLLRSQFSNKINRGFNSK